jgi:pilus assembly protein CpaE
LFVDLSESGDPLNDINALAEVCEPGTVVIAAGQVNDVRLYRDLVASGIQDYLLKPFSPDQLRDAFANAQMTISGPRLVESGNEKPNVMAAIIGVRGGVGASTVATSLAWLMGDKGGRSTALLDLDVHFGTGALALDLEPGRGLTDAIENPSRIDGLFIERAMVRANDKLCVLSAEAPINQSMLTDGSAFYQLQEEIRHAFEGTVIDLPRNMMVQYPHLLNDVHVVIIVVEFTLSGTRDAIRILSWLKANAPQARVIVVANRCQPAVQEVSRKDFEHSIERKVDIALPFDPKTAAQAAKLGQPLAKVTKSAKLSQPLNQLLTLTVEHAAAESEDKPRPSGGGSLLGKLGNFKSLVSKKPKEASAAA